MHCVCVYVWCLIDCVVRKVYYKYFHPKEALISNGVLNRYGGVYTYVCIYVYVYIYIQSD